MRINTNLMAMNTFTQYTANNNKIAGSIAKLSSGYAINSAADNAAGLAISEKMRAQIRGLTKASANAQDAISLVQTAEGSLGEATEILQRMRELAVQAASDTNENEIDRAALQDEFAQLQQELNDIASTTTFNKKNLLDGSLAATQRTVTDAKPANSGMAFSVGKAAAGSYTFQVVVRQETAKIDAVQAKSSASLGSVASATFKEATGGQLTVAGALYNGNYTLEATVNDDKSITVKANGDNGQTFYAKVTEDALKDLDPVDTTKDKLVLNFASTEDAATADFSITLTVNTKPSISENGLLSVKEALEDVTVSVEGGVDEQKATYGVYATLTGGEAVKLQSGDSSVTFSNGVTVSFDKLTATDVTVDTSGATPALSSGLLSKLGGKDASDNDTTVSTFKVVEEAGKGLTFQVGANRGDEMVINLDAVDCKTLGINSAKVTTQEAAAAAIEAVDSAINKVSSQRAYLGAIQNRLEYKINNLETSTENLTSAESQIRDVDMAKEMTQFTNANILQQAATAMLAQANSLPQNVLSLIRG